MEVSKASSSLGDQTTLTLATMASEKEAAIMEAVDQLQAELLWLPHPKNVLKYMKRLNDLPMTVNVLSETGIGRTVNILCKYEKVGAMARNIVERWKNLVPVDEGSNSDLDLYWEEQDSERSSSRKRHHEDSNFSKACKSLFSQPPSPGFKDKKHPKLWEPERSPKASPDHERRDERKQCNQMLSLDCPGSSGVQSQPSASLQQVNVVNFSHQEEKDQKCGKGPGLHIQDKVKTIQESSLGEPSQVKPGPFNESWGQKENFALSREKLSNVTSREVCQMPPSGTDTKDKQNNATRTDKNKESCSVKNRFPPLEFSFVKQITKTDHQDVPEPKLENAQQSKDLVDAGKWFKDKGESNNVQTQEGKYKAPSSPKSTTGCLLESGEPEPCDKDEQPTTSYGSHVSYACQPQRKSNINIPIAVHENKDHIEDDSATTDSKSPNSVQDLPKMNDGKPEKPPSGAILANLKNISTHVTPHLGDIIMPTVQASCQIPSRKTPLPLKPKKKTASYYHEEEGIGFTGRRSNSKMQVYSGPKCVYRPQIISLRQQCMRVLNNNLDSILSVGNVPYALLEPVLEKCTPKQLRRIEGYNHVLIKDTDKLWKIHCNRDFKNETPRESESWRELYFRLQEAREQRLQHLKENFRLAYANKSKGHQTMMAFVDSVAKPPRDVRKRQEKFGTGIAAFPKMINTKPAPYTPTTHYSGSDVKPYADPSTSGTSTSSASTSGTSTSTSTSGTSTSSTHPTPSVSSTGSCDSRKKAAKKLAPMMAKTIKAFKNRFSRR